MMTYVFLEGKIGQATVFWKSFCERDNHFSHIILHFITFYVPFCCFTCSSYKNSLVNVLSYSEDLDCINGILFKKIYLELNFLVD